MSAQPNPANDRGVAALQAALTVAQVELAQARGEIARLTAAARAAGAATAGAGWVIKNGADTLFRKWGGWGTEWTDDPAQALYFARRTDAEAFCAEDEDVWRVVELPLPEVMTHRHVKRGTAYQVLGHAELQQAGEFGPSEGDTLTIYRAQDGKMWARARSEFDDGRFEPLTPDGATT